MMDQTAGVALHMKLKVVWGLAKGGEIGPYVTI